MTCNCTYFIYNEELLHEIWREKSYDFLKWLQFPEETYTPCLIMINIEATCEENTKVFAPISNVQKVLKFPESYPYKLYKKLRGNLMET